MPIFGFHYFFLSTFTDVNPKAIDVVNQVLTAYQDSKSYRISQALSNEKNRKYFK